MRKRVLIILGVLLIAASTIQMATAAANARKAARAPAPVTQQPRDSPRLRPFKLEAVIDFDATRTGHLFLRRANDI
jgi:hypothetical protein